MAEKDIKNILWEVIKAFRILLEEHLKRNHILDVLDIWSKEERREDLTLNLFTFKIQSEVATKTDAS